MINNLRSIGALGVVYVACAAVGTGQAATGAAPTGNTPPWLEVLNERSEGLNREYGLDDHAERRQLGAPGPDWREALQARSEAMNRYFGLGEFARQGARSASAPDWLVALNARSDALNRQYGLGDHAVTRDAGGPDDRAEARGPGAIAAVATAQAAGRDDSAESSGATVIHTDDRSGLRGPGTVLLTVPAAPTVEAAYDGFAWDDAALSAAATLGIGALLGAGAVSIRYRRSPTLR